MSRDLQDNLFNTGERERIFASLIPEISCPEGCDKCCGADLGWFYNRETGECSLEFNCNGTNLVCFRLVNGTCSIYHNRPWICRLYWKREGGLPCFRGLMPNRYLTHEEFKRIIWCIEEGTLQDALALKAWRM